MVFDDVVDSSLTDSRVPADGTCVIDAHAVHGITVIGNTFPGKVLSLVRTDAGASEVFTLNGNRAGAAVLPFTFRP